MSFEILESPQQTVFAPLNTTIDADRDYYSLTGLEACACGGGGIRTRVQMGTPVPPVMRDAQGKPILGPGPAGPGPAIPGTPLQGFYTTGLPEGMYTPDLSALDLNNKMVWALAGLVGLWAFWAWRTPHEPETGDW